jgi:DNA-3-methyladenine glycosylase II
MQGKKLIGKNKLKTAENFLANLDDDWNNLIGQIGPCTIKISTAYEPYQALIKSVIFQQLNPKAGNTIFQRFLNIFQDQFPNAKQILSLDANSLQACGLSRNKLFCITRIADLHVAGKIPDKFHMHKMSDLEIRNTLQSIKGIGPWTINMLLIFNLGRCNIMPSNDLALRINYSKLKGLNSRIKVSELEVASKKWQPYRSIAAWYLWQMR